MVMMTAKGEKRELLGQLEFVVGGQGDKADRSKEEPTNGRFLLLLPYDGEINKWIPSCRSFSDTSRNSVNIQNLF